MLTLNYYYYYYYYYYYTGDASADQRIDFLVKRYLKKAWRKRKWLTRAINQLFDRHDTVWALKCQEDYQALEI
jgi:hypothetical protein